MSRNQKGVSSQVRRNAIYDQSPGSGSPVLRRSERVPQRPDHGGSVKRFIALIALFAGLTLVPSTAYPFGKNKIVYDQFKWKIYHSTHFDIYFYAEEEASLQKVVNLAESAYDDLSRKFNFQITKKVPLIYYATHSAFEQTNTLLTFIPEGVGAFAEPVRNRMVLPIDMPDEELFELIKHELTHIFEYEILFQGRLGQELRVSPPQWLMEGLASFMAQDESTRDRMVLRDAVVNDNIPSIAVDGVSGFFAYRFGHSVFRYMVAKYGWDGLRDFIYEYRNTLGSGIEKPLRRAFDLSPEEFDSQFRTWLRKQYLPALITKGEPTEYGEPFTVDKDIRSQETSPIIGPSGDLLAALTTFKEDVDVVLFNVPERKLFRTLTRGLPDEYEYVIAQWLTSGPVLGRDVGFSPTGDQIAVFVKKERGRNLLLINALSGDIQRSVPMEVEQQLSPAYSADGSKIAFQGFRGNQADIFVYDLSSGSVTNLTNDPFYDGAPVFSPDGKWLVYSSVINGHAKLLRLDLSDPSKRYQLTTGEFNDTDAFFSPDGKRIFFASDRFTDRLIMEASRLLERAENKAKDETDTPEPNAEDFASYNIYSLNLENGDVLQYTDVVGGSFTPLVFIGKEAKERLIFSSYYKGRWRLYTTLTDSPLGEPGESVIASEPLLASARTAFLPPVEVSIDPEKIDTYGRFRLFVDDIQVNAGVNSDQTFISRSVIYMSDMLGNRRFIAALDSVSTFSNFDFLYLDLTKRMNWGVRLFDDRTYFVEQRISQGLNDRRLEYRQTGALGLVSYPFDRYHRFDIGAGYMLRSYNQPVVVDQDGDGVPDGIGFAGVEDDFPFISATYTGDSARFKNFGPISGRRYELTTNYAVDLKEGGTLSNDYILDFRQYFQLTSRTLLAARVSGFYADGNRPNFTYFGGLNTLRGYDFRTFVGNRAAYANFEVRFPLVDLLAFPVFALSQIRGSLFFDVGGAYFDGQDFNFFEEDRLVDGAASVGYGITVNLFGLQLHWDFARRTDLKELDPETRTTFWIGQTF